MKNYKVKIGAFICAILVGLSCAGCSDTTWSIQYNNEKMPAGVYIYFLMAAASKVESGTASSSESSSSTSSKSSTDVWSTKIDNKSAVAWAMDDALNQTKKYAVIEKLCKENKITLSSEETSSVKTNADTMYTNYKNIFSKNGISQASIERIYTDGYLYNKLGTAFYGSTGKTPITDSEIKDYYNNNFIQIKQIFINKNDSNNKALTGSKLTDATNKANEAFAAAKADPANFDKYMKKYNEDPGQTADTKGIYTGYIFDKAITNSSSLDSKFTELAFKLNVGEVNMTSSDMGYFIEYRAKLDPDYTKNIAFSTSATSCKEQARSEMISDKISKFIEAETSKVTVTQNSTVINKYNPKNMKLS